ncbi:hypothetical protein HMI56_001806 [Coelomomyces lativittatus]|nr:hypothetical protein HMI56_001806 [Coelomomyces lativittatus]
MMLHFLHFAKSNLNFGTLCRDRKKPYKLLFHPFFASSDLPFKRSQRLSSYLHNSPITNSFYKNPLSLNKHHRKPLLILPLSRTYYTNPYEKRRIQQEKELSWYCDKRSLYMVTAFLTGGSLYYVYHLDEVPITGRKRFLDFSKKQEERLGKSAYRTIIYEFGPSLLPPSHPTVRMVAKVAGKLIQAARMENLDWKVHVIDSPEKNAFVLPGGMIFVFTGILPICQDEDGLAVVLGHEIAHQFARHSAEKMSFTKILFILQLTLSLVFDTSMYLSQFLTQMLLSLPFSRKMENEADYIGLLLTANACYDPRVAIDVWKRMASAKRLNPPEFLSTHPNPSTRIERLRELMPQALQKREDAGCQNLRGYFDDFINIKKDIF